MNVLAIDPGTQCGWAIGRKGIEPLSGTWNLKGGRFDGGGMRFLRLKSHLNDCLRIEISKVVFEEVRRHLGTDAAHIYGGIVATLTAWCEEHKISYEGIPVGTVKKLATGKGNANKAAMLAAARAKWPGQAVKDDNQADALWLLEAA